MSMFGKLKDQVANAGEKLKDEIQKVQEQAKEKRAITEVDKVERNERFASIKVSTSSINQNYEVVDIIFAFDSHKEGFLETGADPTKAFLKVVNRLRSICADLGGDAVINCQFDYRYAVGSSIAGNAKQVVEIYAYGTAVKFI